MAATGRFIPPHKLTLEVIAHMPPFPVSDFIVPGVYIGPGMHDQIKEAYAFQRRNWLARRATVDALVEKCARAGCTIRRAEYQPVSCEYVGYSKWELRPRGAVMLRIEITGKDVA